MSTNMQEPSQPVEAQPVEAPAGEPRATEATLSEEFREFGRQLGTLLRVVRESPAAREIETQVKQVMTDVERQVDQAMVSARQRVQEQNLQGTFKGAAQTAAEEGQRALVKGLRVVNEQLSHLVQEAEKGTKQGPKAHVIQVETTPVTGADTAPAETQTPPSQPPASDSGEKKWYDPSI